MSSERNKEQVTWESRLRDVGLRVTRQRLLVLAALEQAGGHRSAEAVGVLLENDGAGLSRGTVYKVLDDLVATGIVMLADRGPGTALYEIADEWHHHFVCRSCGDVIDIPCEVGSKPCLDVSILGAEVDEAQVIFRGRCPTCVSSG
ncbi:MAG: Fur family transcriptional regulator [Acidimicrobiales bacterium]